MTEGTQTKKQNLDLALIGNSCAAALVDQNARIVWWCYPHFDSDPVFSRLLAGDEEKGFCDVTLANLVQTESQYVRNTAIVETILTDANGGKVRISDFAPNFERFERVYRPPQIIRRIEPIAGLPRITIRVRLTHNYGRPTTNFVVGSNHIRYLDGEQVLRLNSDAPLSYIVNEISFPLTRPVNLIFGQDDPFLSSAIETTSREFLDRTRDYWQAWVRYLALAYEWQVEVVRAAITLKLCSFAETGAIVAAHTTSIPEAPFSSRTWDYRYCWLRDAYFVVDALNRLGATQIMESYISYITTIASGDDEIQPLHGIVPFAPLEERIAPDLKGFLGMGPVRVGNQAASQRQNDVYGSVVLAATQMFVDERLPKMGDESLFRLLEGLGERAIVHAFEPDAGLWEYRTRALPHTYSATLCWAACDRLAGIARKLKITDRAKYWAANARALRKRILEEGWDEKRGALTGAFGSSDLDASVLLVAELGLVSSSDPRFIKTCDAIGRELMRNGRIMRYTAPDDFGAPETAFLACNFWYIDALYQIGRKDEARELFESILARRNAYGLLSEDIHPDAGELWGNIPQTYSMAGIITARNAAVVELGGSMGARLIIVSNRVAVPETPRTPLAGGMAVAVKAALKNRNGMWFGWSGKVSEEPNGEPQVVDINKMMYVLIDLSQNDIQEYYNGLANSVLWPILHYRVDLQEYSRADASGYIRVNRMFADRLSALLREDDVVWVHDYHLMLLGRELRARASQHRRIFLHTPCAPPDILQTLPHHREILGGLAYYNLVGFQTENDRDNFAHYLISQGAIQNRSSYEFEGQKVRLGAFPVSIETKAYTRLARNAGRSAMVALVRESLGGNKLILGVDRLDYSKGIPNRVKAFERLLENNPEWRGNVTLLQVTPKSRSDIKQYGEIETELTGLIGKVNGQYGDPAWTPIRYVNRSHSRTVLAGLYRAADVAMVTPLRDGMNLVAKEYLAAQDPDDPGVLVLSQFAGAAKELTGALIVNPHESDAVAAALKRALEMPLEERRERHGPMLEHLMENDVRKWAEDYLATLVEGAPTRRLLEGIRALFGVSSENGPLAFR